MIILTDSFYVGPFSAAYLPQLNDEKAACCWHSWKAVAMVKKALNLAILCQYSQVSQRSEVCLRHFVSDSCSHCSISKSHHGLPAIAPNKIKLPTIPMPCYNLLCCLVIWLWKATFDEAARSGTMKHVSQTTERSLLGCALGRIHVLLKLSIFWQVSFDCFRHLADPLQFNQRFIVTVCWTRGWGQCRKTELTKDDYLSNTVLIMKDKIKKQKKKTLKQVHKCKNDDRGKTIYTHGMIREVETAGAK